MTNPSERDPRSHEPGADPRELAPEERTPPPVVTPPRERERELDQALTETFPASDPVPPKHVD